MSRRTFFAGAGAALATAGLPARAAGRSAAPTRLVAKPGNAQLLEAGEPATAIWGYDGKAPGPVLRTRQGEAFAADLVNELPQPTTVHWHGIRIDNAMDGVTGLTQAPVEPGETFAYRFSPPDAGTYWYHPHNRTWEQMARGLHGAFIVEENTPPNVDQDRVLIFDDWRLKDDGGLHEESLGSLHDISHMGRLGNIVTLNGRFSQDLPVLAGERLRLRLINAANARIIGIVFEGHNPQVVALDGQPVATPFAPKSNMVILAPAQRADIMIDATAGIGARTKILLDTGRERLHMGDLVYDGERERRAAPLQDGFILPANPMPTDLDLDTAVEVPMVMTGGARSAFSSARYKGKEYGIRELARQHRKVWAFNDIVGLPDERLFGVSVGQTVKVRLVNKTAWPHAMHFHGHHVLEVAHSARAPLPHWRDTIFIERGQEITVAFKAHNPGLWMLHCHMLEHQAGGMATWYEVDATA